MTQEFVRQYQHATQWSAKHIIELDRCSPNDQVSLECIRLANVFGRYDSSPLEVLSHIKHVCELDTVEFGENNQ